MPSKLLRRNSLPYDVLKTLALAGGIIFLSSISPLGGAQIVRNLVQQYFRKKKFEKNRFFRDLKNLQTRKLIDYEELSSGNIKIILSKLGERKVIEYKIDDIKLNKNSKWDGLWRMVMFDIPHHMKQARDAFRTKLRQLGFHPIQKSVFIVPYQCEDEIDFICSIFGIRNYVLIFYIKKFEGEEKLRHHFGI